MSDFEKCFKELTSGNDYFDIKLNPPATEESISDLEEGLGCTLPDGLLRYLKIADGETVLSEGLFGGEKLNSCSLVYSAHDWLEVEIGDEPDIAGHFIDCPFVTQGRSWRPTWIPIVWGYHSTCLYIDTEPSAEGVHGQIILSAQVDGYRGGIVASSVEDLFIRMKSFEPNELILYYPFIDPNTGKAQNRTSLS